MPFTGRAAELRELRAWRTSEPARAVRVLCGEAGVGKTRLALEMAAEHRANGGESRLVPVGEEADAIRAARAATTGRLLLVVDRAETRPGLGELLRSVPDDPGPVRVLLIARVLGEWWDRLVSASEPAVSRLLTETEPLQLTMHLNGDPSDADLAKAALPHFAQALSFAGPRQVTIAPADRRVPLLVVHAAALAALLRFYAFPVATLRVVISDDAVDELLEHEARHWVRSASAAGLDAEAALVKQVLAASSLLGPASVEEASDIVARVPGLGGRPARERLRWAQWLEESYPAGSDCRLGEVQPEMVAETHVVTQLSDDPQLARSCLRGLPAGRAEHALSVLTRAWAHQDHARPLIASALREDLAGLGVPASRVALHTQGDLGGLLADVLDDTPAPREVLTDIALNMPYPSKVLARAHLAVTKRVRESLPADTKPKTVSEWDARVARLQAELGRDAPGQHGRQIASVPRPADLPAEPASPAADSAARPAEPAPAADPAARPAGPAAPAADSAATAATPATPAQRTDQRTANPDTTATGRASAPSPAKTAAEPAKHGRPGEQDRGGTKQASARKAGRSRRAGSRADRGRGRSGRASATKPPSQPAESAEPTRPEDSGYLETVAAYRELADNHPGRYRADLATALINLGLRLSQLGRTEEALRAGQEALSIRRELDEADPDRFRAELATCLVSIGVWYSELGRTGAALKAEQEAVSIRRELVAIDPARYRPDLAMSLANLGVTLSERGRAATALGPVGEAVMIYRDLAITDPRRYLPDLARCLANLGIRYAELDRPAEALPPSEEAVAIRRDLARVSPDRHRPDLARSLVNLGFRYSELERWTDAVRTGQEAVTIYRALATAGPGYRGDLARALSGLAAALDALGRDTEAERAEGEAAQITRKLEQSRASGSRSAGSGDRDLYQDPLGGQPGQKFTSART